jgi:hypothetical protein
MEYLQDMSLSELVHQENSADPTLVGILSGPGDRACFLSEFPESPVCFDSVMVCPRSVRLAGIHQFLVILEIRHCSYQAHR